MQVWIVYLEDEPGFIGAFDDGDDAYEFQQKYAVDNGRRVLLTPVTLPYRESDYQFTAYIQDAPAEDD